ncbi:hemerythrin [Berryella wangjianweii]|uniref:Hemerythrin n=2 Tax=Berryella wangjianweii TaxID=2734634 RepID=A0A6M8J5W3_9ACTN|nr:hemerythrin [Berryella wangjianweii]
MLMIDVLVEEHDRILVEAARLERMSVELMERNAFSLAEYREMIAFIREFADATHHMKEEDLLFAKMIENLGTVAVNLIQHGMMVEHDEGRLCVRELEAACERYAQQPAVEDKLAIVSWAMQYVHLIRRHIEKENTVVYPFAEKQLDQETWDHLNEAARTYQPAVR